MVSYRVTFDDTPGRDQTEESLTLHHQDGTKETFRLQDYEKIFAYPGLYEQVLQVMLLSRSPQKLASALAGAWRESRDPWQARGILDVGAGNGLVGAELRALGGHGPLVGLDALLVARDAALRDRPGQYAAYLAGPDASCEAPREILTRELSVLTASAALGKNHVESTTLAALWERFPSGSWMGLTFRTDVWEDKDSALGVHLQDEVRSRTLELWTLERFQHRLSLAGDPILYYVFVARKP